MLQSLKARVQRKLREVLAIDQIVEKALVRERYRVAQDLRLAQSIEARNSSAKFIVTRMTGADPVSSSSDVLERAAKEVSVAGGLVCEFGVYMGQSLNFFAKRLSCPIHGFDSFKGLPEDWRSGFPKGAFGLKEDRLPSFPPHVMLHVGWFSETLPPFLAENSGPVSLLHIDCDIYSSTADVFRLIGDRVVPGTIIVFDEYFNYPGWEEHEFKAFEEFTAATGKRFRYLCFNQTHEQVAIRIE